MGGEVIQVRARGKGTRCRECGQIITRITKLVLDGDILGVRFFFEDGVIVDIDKKCLTRRNLELDWGNLPSETLLKRGGILATELEFSEGLVYDGSKNPYILNKIRTLLDLNQA